MSVQSVIALQLDEIHDCIGFFRLTISDTGQILDLDYQ